MIKSFWSGRKSSSKRLHMRIRNSLVDFTWWMINWLCRYMERLAVCNIWVKMIGNTARNIASRQDERGMLACFSSRWEYVLLTPIILSMSQPWLCSHFSLETWHLLFYVPFQPPQRHIFNKKRSVTYLYFLFNSCRKPQLDSLTFQWSVYYSSNCFHRHVVLCFAGCQSIIEYRILPCPPITHISFVSCWCHELTCLVYTQVSRKHSAVLVLICGADVVILHA